MSSEEPNPLTAKVQILEQIQKHEINFITYHPSTSRSGRFQGVTRLVM